MSKLPPPVEDAFSWPTPEIALEKIKAQEKPDIVADHTSEFLGRVMRDWREKAEKDAKTIRPKVLEERVLRALSKL